MINFHITSIEEYFSLQNSIGTSNCAMETFKPATLFHLISRKYFIVEIEFSRDAF